MSPPRRSMSPTPLEVLLSKDGSPPASTSFPECNRSIAGKGKIETAAEVVLIAKSRASLFDEVEKRIIELHPYDCPCIVAWPIEVGYQPYLAWLGQETAS